MIPFLIEVSTGDLEVIGRGAVAVAVQYEVDDTSYASPLQVIIRSAI